MSARIDAGDVVIACLVLGILVVPVLGVLDYQFGGTYTREAYPLDNANNYLDQASSYIPSNPQGVITATQEAWNLTNQSDTATGAGSGSPCWLWAHPNQAYGFDDNYYMGIISSTRAWIASESPNTTANFHNTTFTNWGQIGGAISNAQGVNNNIHGCIFYGNQLSIVETFADLAFVVFGSMILAWLVERK